jgi:hypothetical protein
MHWMSSLFSEKTEAQCIHHTNQCSSFPDVPRRRRNKKVKNQVKFQVWTYLKENNLWVSLFLPNFQLAIGNGDHVKMQTKGRWWDTLFLWHFSCKPIFEHFQLQYAIGNWEACVNANERALNQHSCPLSFYMWTYFSWNSIAHFYKESSGGEKCSHIKMPL